MLQTTEPQTIEITCKGKMKHVAVKSTENLLMESGCQIETKDHFLFAGHSVKHDEKVHQWPMNWEVEMLFDLTESKLEQVIAKLRLLKATPTTVRNLHQLLADTGNFPTFQHINIFLTLGITILAVIIFGIMGYLTKIYFVFAKKI